MSHLLALILATFSLTAYAHTVSISRFGAIGPYQTSAPAFNSEFMARELFRALPGTGVTHELITSDGSLKCREKISKELNIPIYSCELRVDRRKTAHEIESNTFGGDIASVIFNHLKVVVKLKRGYFTKTLGPLSCRMMGDEGLHPVLCELNSNDVIQKIQ